ncbi:MAG: GEVED domain-containing protein, partial [Cruoricaptor ignavus]|nr:GEVED domain-containing protein [Cruoricaptor ignavus]
AYDMVEFYGSIADVENKIVALINGVNVDYATVFNKTIKFDIVSTNISDGATSSLDTALGTGDAAGAILGNFSNWSEAGNLSNSTYDLGLLYLKRQMQNGIVGLAGVGTFCSARNYTIVRDYRNNLSLIRNVTSHEIGHTFGCGHTTGIMAAVSSESSVWDQISIDTINNKEASTNCNQGNNALQGSATAAFNLAATACKNEVIALNANMSRDATVFDWSALGSTTENLSGQTVTTSYTTAGEKTISLEVSNNFTCDGNISTATISKNIQVLEMDVPTETNCTYQTSNTGMGGLYGISPVRVVFGTINRSSGDAADDKFVYDNRACIDYTTVEEGSTTAFSVSREYGGNPAAVRVWIDFNNDGVFDNNTETVLNIRGNYNATNTGEITIPENALIKDKILRMRVVTELGTGNITNPCRTNYGQIEDYGVIIVESLSTTETKTASEIVLANNPIGNSAEFILPKNISDKKIKIHAYDMSGKWIATQTLQNNNGRAIIPTSAWEKGAYLFVIEFDGKMQKSIKALK